MSLKPSRCNDIPSKQTSKTEKLTVFISTAGRSLVGFLPYMMQCLLVHSPVWDWSLPQCPGFHPLAIQQFLMVIISISLSFYDIVGEKMKTWGSKMLSIKDVRRCKRGHTEKKAQKNPHLLYLLYLVFSLKVINYIYGGVSHADEDWVRTQDLLWSLPANPNNSVGWVGWRMVSQDDRLGS